MSFSGAGSTRSNARVLVVRYGTLKSNRAHIFLNYHLYDEPDARQDLDYFFWIIDDPVGIVLVDTGFSRGVGNTRGRQMLIDPVQVVEELGRRPEDVFSIIVTHAHYDHIGNLRHFPNATLYVTAAEYNFWASPTAEHVQFAKLSETSEIEELQRAAQDGRLTTFDREMMVTENVRVELVGGHTPGQSIVTVATRDGDVLIASDAVHLLEELDRDMPFIAAANLPAMYAAFRLIKTRVAGGAILLSGHDPSTLSLFPPLEGPLGRFISVAGSSDRAAALSGHPGQRADAADL